MTDFLERLQSGKQSRQRIMETIASADKDARKATHAVTSPNGAVLVIMDGEFRTREVAIHPEIYEGLDADGLADQVVMTYNLARKVVHGEQLRRILHPNSSEMERL